jgi:hypothetical protein
LLQVFGDLCERIAVIFDECAVDCDRMQAITGPLDSAHRVAAATYIRCIRERDGTRHMMAVQRV